MIVSCIIHKHLYAEIYNIVFFLVTCSCNKIIIEKSDLKILNGAYTKIEAVRGGKPIYQKEKFYLVWSDTRHEWYINPDYTKDSYYAINKVSNKLLMSH